MRTDVEIKKLFKKAQALSCCQKFTGREKTLEEVVAIFSSVQGVEFCMKNNFPKLIDFRMFNSDKLSKLGVYVDRGDIFIKNPKFAAIVGETKASILCNSTEVHNILVLHGAICYVTANDYSLVKVQCDKQSVVTTYITDWAKII